MAETENIFSELVSDKEKLKSYLENGGNPNIRNDRGSTLLHFVADAETASMLIEAGADVNAKNDRGNVPLHFVEHANVAKLFIEAGADVNIIGEHNRTPLYNVVQNAKEPEVVQLLVNAGADINTEDCNYQPPLFYVSNNPDLKCKEDIIGILEKAGARDLPSMEELITDKEKLSAYLENGGNPNMKNDMGQPFLSFVENVEIASIYIEAGADVNASDPETQDTVLHNVLMFEGSREMVNLLLENGADITAKNIDGQTPLDYAKEYGSLEIISMLEKAENHAKLKSEISKQPTIVQLLYNNRCNDQVDDEQFDKGFKRKQQNHTQQTPLLYNGVERD